MKPNSAYSPFSLFSPDPNKTPTSPTYSPEHVSKSNKAYQSSPAGDKVPFGVRPFSQSVENGASTFVSPTKFEGNNKTTATTLCYDCSVPKENKSSITKDNNLKANEKKLVVNNKTGSSKNTSPNSSSASSRVSVSSATTTTSASTFSTNTSGFINNSACIFQTSNVNPKDVFNNLTNAPVFDTTTSQFYTSSSSATFGVSNKSQSSVNLSGTPENSSNNSGGSGRIFGTNISQTSVNSPSPPAKNSHVIFGAGSTGSGTNKISNTSTSIFGVSKPDNNTNVFGGTNSGPTNTGFVFASRGFPSDNNSKATTATFGTSKSSVNSCAPPKNSHVTFRSNSSGTNTNQVSNTSTPLFGVSKPPNDVNVFGARNPGTTNTSFGFGTRGFPTGNTWPSFPAQTCNFNNTPSNPFQINNNPWPFKQRQDKEWFLPEVKNMKGQCCTDTVVKRESFIWSINNFRFRTEKRGESIQSSTFISGTDSKYERYWQLDIYPNGYADIDPQLIPLKINLLNHNEKSETRVIINVSLLNTHFNKYYRTTRGFGDKSVIIPETGVIYCETFLRKDDLNETTGCLTSNGTLIILFEVGTTIESSTTSKITKQFKPPIDLLRNFITEFYVDEKFTDVVIEIEGGELKAHKMILAAHSPVFARMFDEDYDDDDDDKGAPTTDVDERNKNRIKIDNMKLNVAKSMMEYIYTNKKPGKINEFTTELMIAAQRYEIEGLKIMCEEILYKNITIENGINTLITAHKHCIQELKEEAIQYIKDHGSILRSIKFKDLERDYPALALEVFRTIAFDKIDTMTDE